MLCLPADRMPRGGIIKRVLCLRIQVTLRETLSLTFSSHSKGLVHSPQLFIISFHSSAKVSRWRRSRSLQHSLFSPSFPLTKIQNSEYKCKSFYTFILLRT